MHGRHKLVWAQFLLIPASLLQENLRFTDFNNRMVPRDAANSAAGR